MNNILSITSTLIHNLKFYSMLNKNHFLWKLENFERMKVDNFRVNKTITINSYLIWLFSDGKIICKKNI